jgi:hypothetical protein
MLLSILQGYDDLVWKRTVQRSDLRLLHRFAPLMIPVECRPLEPDEMAIIGRLRRRGNDKVQRDTLLVMMIWRVTVTGVHDHLSHTERREEPQQGSEDGMSHSQCCDK